MEIIININDLPENTIFHHTYIPLLAVRITNTDIYGRFLKNPKIETKISQFLIKSSNMFTTLGCPINLLHFYDKTLCNIHNIDIMSNNHLNIYTYNRDIFNNIKCESFYKCSKLQKLSHSLEH